MSKLEVREIGPISGETEVRLADGATAIGFGGESPIKAWVNFHGGAGLVAIRESFNVSSVTEISNGQYLVNFENEMPDVNYSTAVNGSLYDVVDDANVPQAFIHRLETNYKTNSVGIGATWKSMATNAFNGIALICVIVCR